MESKWPDPPKFDIKYDLYGQGEPRLILFKPGTISPDETIPLSEAERRGVVSGEQAEHARQTNQRIREAMEKAATRSPEVGR